MSDSENLAEEAPADEAPIEQASAEEASAEEASATTPVHLWIVGIVSLLWNAMGATDYVMTETRNEEWLSAYTPEQLEYIYNFPSWVVAFWAIAVWGCLLGSILLLLRKKLAAPVFLTALVSTLVTSLHMYGLSNGYEVFGGVGPLVFSAVIVLVTAGLFFYSRAMRDRGVLS